LKKIFFYFFIFISLHNYGQSFSFEYGLKAGINFNNQLNITSNIESISNNSNIFETRKGHHFGGFLKLSLKDFYLKPEINYSQIKNNYDIPNVSIKTENIITNFNQNKIDIPVLIGYNIFNQLSVFTGPRFEFVKNVDSESFDINDLKNDYRIGLQFGIGLKISKFEVDIRVERGFEKNEIKYMKENAGIKNQFITSKGKLYLLAISFYL